MDVCDMVDDGTHLTISKASFLAIETDLGAADAVGSVAPLLPLGRRSKLDMESRQSRISLAAATGGTPPPEVDYVSKIFDSAGKIFGKEDPIGKYLEKGGASLALFTAGWSLVSSIFGFGGPSGPSIAMTTINYLDMINTTTFKILAGVTQIQNTLDHVDSELGKLLNITEVNKKILECVTQDTAAKGKIDILANRWRDYTMDGLLHPRNATAEALIMIQKGKQPRKQPADVFGPWADTVLEGINGDEKVYDALSNLHKRLVGDSEKDRPEDGGIIQKCAVAFTSKWRQDISDDPKLLYSFDDRQYFKEIQNLVRYYQLWAARGMHMLQEAYLFRAQRAALNAWVANQAVSGCNTTSPSVNRTMCVIDAELLPPDGPLLCVRLQSAAKRLRERFPDDGNLEDALTYCEELDRVSKDIIDNVYLQQEIAGIPYSWGGAGEGVRLVLGSDVTSRDATVLGKATKTQTEWLVAASPQAFSRNCTDPLVRDSRCPIVGSFDSLSLQSARLNAGYTLGYADNLWLPAGAEVWQRGLRGMQPLTQNAVASLLSIMELGQESLGAVPFANIRDRLWVRSLCGRYRDLFFF